jgi:hypothetical protein
MKKIFNYFDALQTLCPTASYCIDGNNYSSLQWYDNSIPIPTEKEIIDKINDLEVEYDNTEYQRHRASEYPPITDYLDAVVKGDQEQMQQYIDACLAVKAKYPKPEGA